MFISPPSGKRKEFYVQNHVLFFPCNISEMALLQRYHSWRQELKKCTWCAISTLPLYSSAVPVFFLSWSPVHLLLMLITPLGTYRSSLWIIWNDMEQNGIYIIHLIFWLWLGSWHFVIWKLKRDWESAKYRSRVYKLQEFRNRLYKGIQTAELMQLNTGSSYRYGVLVPITVTGDLGFIYLLKSRCSVLSELVFKSYVTVILGNMV